MSRDVPRLHILSTTLMPLTIRFGTTTYDLSARTHLMGVLNVAPDSFSDGGSFSKPEDALRHGMSMQESGADFIDVGGESTRPGAVPVEMEEELRRILPVIEQLAKRVTIPISIDTMKSDVAKRAIDAGASFINDISAGTVDPAMIPLAGISGVPMVLMHMKGTPANMQEHATYKDVSLEVTRYLIDRAMNAQRQGVKDVIIDPGIGFAKTAEHSIRLIRDLPMLAATGYPVLVGPSRKSFIGTILNVPVNERLEGTSAAVAACIFAGANIVRVHDVKAMKRVASMCDALKPLGVLTVPAA